MCRKVFHPSTFTFTMHLSGRMCISAVHKYAGVYISSLNLFYELKVFVFCGQNLQSFNSSSVANIKIRDCSCCRSSLCIAVSQFLNSCALLEGPWPSLPSQHFVRHP